MPEQFYLGRPYDLKNGKVLPQPLMYDPADLTTHAVVTGMTGSGKTGLCIDLMEEAALQGIPAILVDPKGDLTNLLLHFPNLAPQDFQPWLDADTIRRQGKSLEQAAGEAAAQWKQGLAEWDIDPERIRALANAAQFAIYTPGSDAGIQVSVLSSLEAPPIPWEGNKEILREKISSTTTALLGLVGYNDVDPLRSREHILISNVFEYAWSHGKSLDMTELILQVQTPPFDKLGAFALDSFFPAKDRNELAMTLNNILASPAFEAWREGAPLDIPGLLFAADGRPRHSVFYLAHLSEGERMFFVTLLLSAFETWMRTQAGSTSLRALLYFDELFGYLPPTAVPPSKTPLLRLLKQARAFGVGLVLATQNPVDVDYKALSNAGSWFIGKLQTERDKERLLDGLQAASGEIDRNVYGQVISALGKRVFLLHNIHAKGPALLQTRWTMNFLAGPLTRAQLPALNALVGASAPNPSTTLPKIGRSPDSAGDFAAQADLSSFAATDLSGFQPIPVPETESKPEPVSAIPSPSSVDRPSSTVNGPSSALPGSETKPVVPNNISEYFLPVNYSLTEAFKASGQAMPVDSALAGVLYRPTVLASAKVRFLDRRYGIDSEIVRDALVQTLDKRGAVRWDDFPYDGPALEKLESQPAPQARFASLDAPLGDAKLLATLQKDFADWVFRTTTISARANTALKVYAGPDISPADFRTACSDAAREARDAETAKLTAQLDRQIAALQDKLAREQRELKQDEVELGQRKMEEGGNLAELGAGLLGIGRKKSLTTQLTKRRMTEQAKAEVDESVQVIDQYQRQLQELQQKREQAVQDINEKWASVVNQITEIPMQPKKSDVYVEYFGVAWQPSYLIRAGGQVFELPAFGAE